MDDRTFQLPFPPIIEAIVDIDCELDPVKHLADLEPAVRQSLQDRYPKVEKRMRHQFQIRKDSEAPPEHVMEDKGLDAILLRSEDGKQLTQFRRNGYSFNRLAPYEGMDTYLPEIQRTWENYRSLVKPLRIRKIGLRTINRIQIPLNVDGNVDLEHYLRSGPQIPSIEGRELTFTGFLNQHRIADTGSGQHANIILATKEAKDEQLTILLDIDAYDPRPRESLDWVDVVGVVGLLRSLKNDLFRGMVTEECLKLFSAPGSSS